MGSEQDLNDAKKEAADNERNLDHWQTQHDKLKLEEIEWVLLALDHILLESSLAPERSNAIQTSISNSM